MPECFRAVRVGHDMAAMATVKDRGMQVGDGWLYRRGCGFGDGDGERIQETYNLAPKKITPRQTTTGPRYQFR
jgi:hypothetical protein